MIGCNCNEACAKHRVGPRGEYVDATSAAGKTEGAFQPLRFADPVFLHQPHLVGPLVKRPKSCQQLVGEVGDFEKPLAELAALDRRA